MVEDGAIHPIDSMLGRRKVERQSSEHCRSCCCCAYVPIRRGVLDTRMPLPWSCWHHHAASPPTHTTKTFSRYKNSLSFFRPSLSRPSRLHEPPALLPLRYPPPSGFHRSLLEWGRRGGHNGEGSLLDDPLNAVPSTFFCSAGPH